MRLGMNFREQLFRRLIIFTVLIIIIKTYFYTIFRKILRFLFTIFTKIIRFFKFPSVQIFFLILITMKRLLFFTIYFWHLINIIFFAFPSIHIHFFNIYIFNCSAMFYIIFLTWLLYFTINASLPTPTKLSTSLILNLIFNVILTIIMVKIGLNFFIGFIQLIAVHKTLSFVSFLPISDHFYIII